MTDLTRREITWRYVLPRGSINHINLIRHELLSSYPSMMSQEVTLYVPKLYSLLPSSDPKMETARTMHEVVSINVSHDS